MSDPRFAPLLAEFDAWAAAGRVARLWLRDDDATEPGPALARLLALAEAAGTRILVAAIPYHATAALADMLRASPAALVSQHGWSHKNHAPGGEKSCEFPKERPLAVALDEIARGREKLAALFGDRVRPIFTPPWNRIGASALAALPSLGFAAASLFSGADHAPVAGLARLDCAVDIMDWRATRKGFPPEIVVADLVAALAAARQGDGGAIGVLTHHRVHGDNAWAFLDGLAEAVASHEAVAWTDADALLSA